MTNITVNEFIPVLQISISPVILISGVGLLLLSMTNRLGRVIDRSRFLWRELREVPDENREAIHAQLQILSRRAELIRRAIILASISVLLAAILIIVLFIAVLLNLEAALIIIVLFIGCMLTLIISLITFIKDVNQTLIAFKVEIKE
ncbi:MAG: DUF2721 domain-containing protein [Candidatus Tritonobacter lacicola]|nr:DUF2721 domain-containing protein [Candidatus Tritonobacter lacicola]